MRVTLHPFTLWGVSILQLQAVPVLHLGHPPSGNFIPIM